MGGSIRLTATGRKTIKNDLDVTGGNNNQVPFDARWHARLVN